jgi:DNA-binding MarR family transcriptional regulator
MSDPADAAMEALARALVVIHRYSVDITRIAAQTLGDESRDNRDIQVMTAVARHGRLTPTELQRSMEAPRSTLARALNRLEAAGLVARRPDPHDRRSVLVSLTPLGRRRVSQFADQLGDYFAHGEPLVKELFLLIRDSPVPERGPNTPADPLGAAAAMGAAGARYIAETSEALADYGVRESSDRFTLALLQLYGTQRPSALAEELDMRPSGVTGVLTRLEAAELIRRRYDSVPGDRRAVVVELTPRGQEAADLDLTVFARHAEHLANALALTWRQ